MSFHISLDSLNEIHTCLMDTLLNDPDYESAPRGKPIKELIGASFTLLNPRNRIIDSPARAVNYGFAVGELCWYLRGDTDLATMQYYNRRMSQFSDDGVTINSAYGARMLNEHRLVDIRPSQWSLCVEELRRDPDSRRAVMHINMPSDLRKAVQLGSKDVPCTLSVQLLIRERKLHMHVTMRSNDIVWGLPYDVFSFTFLQEAFMLMLREAGVPVDDIGQYHHTVGSLHLYDTHYEMAGLVSKEASPRPAPMTPVTLDSLEKLAHGDEPFIRNEGWTGDVLCPRPLFSSDSSGWMLSQLVDHWNKRQKESKNT